MRWGGVWTDYTILHLNLASTKFVIKRIVVHLFIMCLRTFIEIVRRLKELCWLVGIWCKRWSNVLSGWTMLFERSSSAFNNNNNKTGRTRVLNRRYDKEAYIPSMQFFLWFLVSSLQKWGKARKTRQNVLIKGVVCLTYSPYIELSKLCPGESLWREENTACLHMYKIIILKRGYCITNLLLIF